MSSPQQAHPITVRAGFACRARRSALMVAITAAIGGGGAAMVAVAGPTSDATARAAAGTALQSRYARTTATSFTRRIRRLEAAGDRDVACMAHGELMFDPRLHRYLTVRL